jgi:hypothetical protein
LYQISETLGKVLEAGDEDVLPKLKPRNEASMQAVEAGATLEYLSGRSTPKDLRPCYRLVVMQQCKQPPTMH